MTKPTVEQLEELSAKATQGEWEACGSERGGCKCGNVWSKDADAPVLNTVIGKWGDDYPALRFTEDSTSLRNLIEPYMEQITYGEVPEELGKANALFIAALVNFWRQGGAELVRDGLKWREDKARWEEMLSGGDKSARKEQP